MKFNKQIFNSLIPILKNRGLTESTYSERSGSLSFYKSNKHSNYQITLELDDTTKGFVNVYGRISFTNVIDILSRFIELRPNVYEAVVVNYDLYKNKEKYNKIFDELESLPLKTDLDIKEFENEIISHIDSYILPFFERFPNAKSVNDEIFEKLDFEEFPNYIPGNCTLKTLIIMKMYNNCRYEEYKNKKDEEYKFYINQNSSMWQSSYDSFLALTSYLDEKFIT
ncbi:hypothetical protein A5M85_16390 [Cellulophaga lytica]|uniref:hypothetical protein n=1 Tax=Cellulophaga lytica TaxID=979 RepID=UPI0009508E0D|nr:hypothetical protein [Cellulophaga lytica]APU11801.1 hypothetical protein A5M85_16390 [Cellulophaga lytica]